MSDIIFTSDVQSELDLRLNGTDPGHVFILTDRNTYRHCLNTLGSRLFLPENVIVTDVGETSKSLESVTAIWQTLSSRGARRNSVLVNLGGGLVTDMGGFAASCFKRGMRCINIPTTLLAQVDASVGGKTGVNLDGLKNEIGTFALPECVIIDNSFLKTLPPRQILSGFAEMLKHALLTGNEAWQELLAVDLSHPESPAFLRLIEKSVGVKKQIVDADPQEHGIRKALNLGHTVGHAIESAAIAQGVELYHGEAVVYGLMVELALSVHIAGFDTDKYHEILRFIHSIYPPYIPLATPEHLYKLMGHDKKNDRGGVNFTLLKSMGEFTLDNYCTQAQVTAALERITINGK